MPIDCDGIEQNAPARNETRLHVEIETDLVGGFGVCSQYIDAPYPKRGEPRKTHKQTIAIYEHELKDVQALVRTDKHLAALETAKSMAPLDSKLAEKRAAIDAALRASSPPTAVARAEQELEEHEREVFAKALENLCSMPGMRNGLPPLLSARVVKQVGPPKTVENLHQNQMSDLASVLERLLDARDGKRKG